MSTSSQLVANFEALVRALNSIIFGGVNDTITLDGVTKPSISKEISDRTELLTNIISSIASGIEKSYASYASFQEALNNGEVPNDITIRIAAGENAGFFSWDGSQLTPITDLGSFIKVSDSPDDLLIISDKSGNILLSIDNEGTIRGEFDLSNVDLGLEKTSEVGGDTILAISDKSGNMLASLNRKGEWYFTKIIADEVVTPFGSSSESTDDLYSGTQITIPELGFYRIDFTMVGAPPTDLGETTLSGTCSFSDPSNSQVFFRSNMEITVQGQGSAYDYKKNYTLDLFNSNMDSLKVKVGSMIATDSFHLKGFYRDPTHFRDQGGYRFWNSLVRKLDYPYCKVNNIVYQANTNRKQDADYTADAKYYPHGIPCMVYLNGRFYGLYTLRLKKTRQNYALNNADTKHIFLDSATYDAYLSQSFDSHDWEIKSPKMSGYEDQGPIPSKFAAVQTSIERLFNFTKDLDSNYQNHASVLVLPHWLVFYIFVELVGHWDINGNNYNIMTWDNAHWSILPYDLDWTLNWFTGDNAGATQTGFIVSGDIWPRFRQVYLPQIRELYTKFRKSGDISTYAIVKNYIDVAKNIPREVYTKDREVWGVTPIFGNSNYPDLEQAYRYIDARIAYLDTVWLIN